MKNPLIKKKVAKLLQLMAVLKVEVPLELMVEVPLELMVEVLLLKLKKILLGANF